LLTASPFRANLGPGGTTSLSGTAVRTTGAADATGAGGITGPGADKSDPGAL
jgi:hypothetical protein